MANTIDKRQFYYGQPVQHTELRAAFDAVEAGFANRYIDHGWHGIAGNPHATPPAQLNATESSPKAMSIEVGIGKAYTNNGDRMVRTVAGTVSIATDKNGASVIPAAGTENWVSVFMVPQFQESDTRVDNSGSNVNFVQQLSHTFEIEQGAEATIAVPTNAIKPSLRDDAVLVADILVKDTTTQISNPATEHSPVAEEIDRTRREFHEIKSIRGTFEEGLEAGWIKLKSSNNDSAFSVDGHFNNVGRVHSENVVHAWSVVAGATGGVSSQDLNVTRAGAGDYNCSLGTGSSRFASVNDYAVFVFMDTQYSSGVKIAVPVVNKTDGESFTVDTYDMDTNAGTYTKVDLDFCVLVIGRLNVANVATKTPQF